MGGLLLGLWLLLYTTSPSHGLSYEKFESDIIAKVVKQAKINKPFATSPEIQVTIVNKKELEDVCIKASSYNFEIKKTTLIIGRTVTPVMFSDQDNQIISKMNVSSFVTVKSNFVKTKKILIAENAITSADIEIVTEDSYGKPENTYRDMAEVIGKLPKATIGKNVCLTPMMIKITPVIKQGQTLEAIYNQHNLIIKVPVRALSDGYAGQKLRVKTLLGQEKTVEGDVIDSQTMVIKSLR